IFDYVITIEDEVRWVWGRSWNATRVVFTISRYLPFVGMGLTAYVSISLITGISGGYMATLSYSYLLLVLRTYAFWQRDKRLLYGLLSYGVVRASYSGRYANSGSSQDITFGCWMIASRNSVLVYALLLAFEFTILGLTAYKRFHDYRGIRTSIVYTTYRDGMFYIICIILITLANVIVDFAYPVSPRSALSAWHDLLNIRADSIQRPISLHSVLASRIMFNLRRSTRSVQQDGTTRTAMPMSTMEYHEPSQSSGSEGTSSLGSNCQPDTEWQDSITQKIRYR
ncbi:hypothetical protein HYDPIDRAFT_101013, partial [Hydnomerulius pinastri MD-312]